MRGFLRINVERLPGFLSKKSNVQNRVYIKLPARLSIKEHQKVMQEANKSGNYRLGIRDKYNRWEEDFSMYILLVLFDF